MAIIEIARVRLAAEAVVGGRRKSAASALMRRGKDSDSVRSSRRRGRAGERSERPARRLYSAAGQWRRRV